MTVINKASQPEKKENMRIAKRIAEAGICSRRKAEEYIEAGRVSVNGKIINSPALNVTYNDEVKVDGEALDQKRNNVRLWLFHKPSGCLTTHSDPQGRTTIFDILPDNLPRVITIGRLDYNSEGLLLLTNNGDVARYCELPKTAWKRCYRVRAFGAIPPAMLRKAAQGLSIDGIRYEPIIIKEDQISEDGSNSNYRSPNKNNRNKTNKNDHIVQRKSSPQSESIRANRWFLVTLTEGKNREIRKVFEHFGLVVNRLIRVSYGPFQLSSLPRGAVKEMTGKQVREQLGNII